MTKHEVCRDNGLVPHDTDEDAGSWDGTPRGWVGPGLPVWRADAIARREIVMATIERTAPAASRIELAGSSVLPRSVVERAGFLAGFPQLVGAVRSFDGDTRAYVDLVRRARAGVDWTGDLGPSGLTLAPAACHSAFAALESLAIDPVEIKVGAQCFRREETTSAMRLQSFFMFEHVYVGTASGLDAFLEGWQTASLEIMRVLGLEVDLVEADDSFYGAGAVSPRPGARWPRKLELVWRGTKDVPPTAVASLNFHDTHFGRAFDITVDGNAASSGCMAFGIDRLVVAMSEGLNAWR